MNVIEFNIELFREQFPEFSNEDKFSDATLQMYFDMATCQISNENYGVMQNNCRLLALNLLTAHLTKISLLIADGQVPTIVQNATIDKITIGLTPPILYNQWQWWLSTTAYGMQLLALLQSQAVGGFYVGGLPEGSAFRKVGGVF